MSRKMKVNRLTSDQLSYELTIRGIATDTVDKMRKALADDIKLENEGHVGVHKTFARLFNKYYWPKMKSDVSSYVRKCPTCLGHKPEQQKPSGLLLTNLEAQRPWEVISTDIIGPLPRSTSGHRFVLVVMDCFSKFSLFFPLRSATASKVTKLIEEQVILMFGVPHTLICDNGVQYRSSEFRQMTDRYGIKIRFNALYHPQANPTERLNRVLKTMLSSYIRDNQRHWDKSLPQIGCAIRSAKHDSTGFSPYFVNFGREYVWDYKDRFPDSLDKKLDPQERVRGFEKLYRDIFAKLVKAHERAKKNYDLRRRPQSYNTGDLVWKRNFVLSKATDYFSSKLAPKFVRPHRISKKLSPWTFELESLDKTLNLGTWHAKDLKLHPDNDVGK